MPPIYSYRCDSCEKIHEKIQTISEGEKYLAEDFKCPECGHDHGKRIMGKTSFSLKGSGWYHDSYN